ncbi:hypothetical protein M407DRAFT_241597 [Tulasnella calospora MUT 4182]|uniref:Uncharacterized protein n=1 Tax=Tulasnella calospora MUT 4182 TaxID=1051891 RepID=A0A0C3QIT1_9AGAM|nr:hypothetical protein M407DRAFT_241597 [Tulasnella calospora MUT 4182]
MNRSTKPACADPSGLYPGRFSEFWKVVVQDLLRNLWQFRCENIFSVPRGTKLRNPTRNFDPLHRSLLSIPLRL